MSAAILPSPARIPPVWLLPIFSSFSRNALKLFYRLTISGERVPRRGPVLLVANHPNSLLDPGMVVAVARRPVRFLAKAPLFDMAVIGWLTKGAGAIPVYRQQDQAQVGPTAQNDDTFRAVWAALAEGAAVGIFPEGTSHSEPSLVPLKTGAARIALGAALRTGGAFPLVPVGLSFRAKETFRSDAVAVVGDAVAWDDLAGTSPDDRDAVRELTRRIDESLHEVTVNLERWDDRPLVEMAEAVYAAELPVEAAADARVARQVEAAEGLARVRAEGRPEWRRVARDVAAHGRVLRVLGLTPAELKASPRADAAIGWTGRQIAFFGLGAPVAALGILVYWIPYRLTGILERRQVEYRDVRATFKLLVGGLFHLLWTIAVATVVGWRFGWVAGLCTLFALPLAGFVALRVTEGWAEATAQARRFFLRTRRRAELDELRARQADLARRLHTLWEEVRV
ncbi:lysophospholipid acyltransferase family protein [Longimicrobium sp.]|uniref:lysophospholipid acyltransferase family protein n=1 Tax=Longimicrobium sp. TaxID=2029185 RepID=UPI002BD4279B|nr:lysophospholipid acyltransferase family protein [Longimicrobium sp.]HSU14626.1 lysophospholipid acyltransferase family protein [Longimicrobium sp.]